MRHSTNENGYQRDTGRFHGHIEGTDVERLDKDEPDIAIPDKTLPLKNSEQVSDVKTYSK